MSTERKTLRNFFQEERTIITHFWGLLENTQEELEKLIIFFKVQSISILAICNQR